MKKLSLSLMLNVSLALMLALSLIYPQSVAVNFVATGRFWRRLSVWLPVVSVCMPLSMYWNATDGAAAGIAGREDCHVAVFAVGAVAQTGSSSGGDGGDIYLAGRCRVDFYRADLSRGIGVLPADTYGLPSAF